MAMLTNIDATIDKWFKWIQSKSQEPRTAFSQTEIDKDVLSTSTIALVKTYADAILLCLNEKKRLPAKALLRVMADVSMKCIWCLRGFQTGPKEFEDRWEKWKRSSLWETQRRLEKEMEVLNSEYSQSNIQNLSDEIKNRLKELEPFHLSRKDSLGVPEVSEIWAQQGLLNKIALYDEFHHAVHPDMIVLFKMIRQDGEKFIYKFDSDEPIDRLKAFCMVIIGHLFETISDINGWGFSEEMKDDLSNLRK
jgi:hypothetical protein